MGRISYSQLRLYGECGKKYEYSYKIGLREKTKSGALLFGTAFDKAIEAVLKNKEIDENEVFDKIWTHQEINKKETYLPESLMVVYAASDFDYDLLQEDDVRLLKVKCQEFLGSEDWYEKYEECVQAKKQRAYKLFTEQQNKYLNICNWLSLRRKGHLMLKTNRLKVLPFITEIHDTQVKIELANADGDSLLGYADLVCTWNDGRKCIIDYKTSASEYEEDSVITSPQLSLYAYGLGIKTAGYFVFKKGIIKNRIKICSICGFDGSGARHKTCSSEVDGRRCGGEWKETVRPEADVQILINDIPEKTMAVVMENVDMVNKAIKAEIFPRNFDSCRKPWGLCPYYDLCFKGDDSDLIKI